MPNTTSHHTQLPHVVVIGAGFGGLQVVRALAKAPVRITLIDRNNYHLFQPLLYQVATAGLSPDEIAHPVRAILRHQRNVVFQMSEALEIDWAQRRVITTYGQVAYDYLVIAAGGKTNYFNLSSLSRFSFGLKDLSDATAIRDHILRRFEEASQESQPSVRRAMLTFVVVGGGPTGIECAGALWELVHLVLAKDYPGLKADDWCIELLEATDRLLPAMPEDLGRAALNALQKRGIRVRFGAAVSSYDGRRVLLRDGTELPGRTVIWAAGVRAVDLLDRLGVAQDSLGRVRVEPSLQLPGHPEVMVIGDAACLEGADGRPLPMIAPVAIQQGKHAARNILRLLRGEEAQPFQYRDPGIMATIGRHEAVARIGSLRFRGFWAWIVWLVVHLIQLIGFRNRLLVLIDWAWQYFSYDRAVRLIGAEALEHERMRMLEYKDPETVRSVAK